MALALSLGTPVATAQQPAFPGAEGAGKFASGGRGTAAVPTTVFEVSRLADDGAPGSLRYALTQPAAARTVVFRVCGTIHLLKPLRIPANTTLAGQTAPGEGICLADRPVSIGGDNVVVRFLRFRLGDRYQNGGRVDGSGHDDALGSYQHRRILLDHCSVSWSTDEALSVYAGDSTTVQWCLISEPLNYSYHYETGAPDFQQHGYGGIWGGRRASFHHNLFAHCQGRNPRFDGSLNLPPGPAGPETCDFRNNVIYNWGAYTIDGGAGGQYNLVNNYYKPGPSTSKGSKSGVPRRAEIIQADRGTKQPPLPYGRYFLRGNYVEGAPAVSRRNWLGAAMSGGSLADTARAQAAAPFDVPPVPTETAAQAYAAVLQHVGCVLPARDTLDQRIIRDVLNGTGRLIDVQGGYPHGTPYAVSQSAWPVLRCGPAPADTDHDGMPDSWEKAHQLNLRDAADRSRPGPDGYTALEQYLNSLVRLPPAQ
ncbi:pectate lyase [Hymenobacter edaphi]|uniref:Pectate lyase n=1 Tax=Hymenobacter edaphi TaxID=2211146 RepID=A0A328BGJ5_9BACT|nr:pectate lyase [Hymenobacter edaphi]